MHVLRLSEQMHTVRDRHNPSIAQYKPAASPAVDEPVPALLASWQRQPLALVSSRLPYELSRRWLCERWPRQQRTPCATVPRSALAACFIKTNRRSRRRTKFTSARTCSLCSLRALSRVCSHDIGQWAVLGKASKQRSKHLLVLFLDHALHAPVRRFRRIIPTQCANIERP